MKGHRASKRCKKILLLCLGLTLITNLSFAADGDIQELMRRMDRLEKENAALKVEVMELKRKVNQSDSPSFVPDQVAKPDRARDKKMAGRKRHCLRPAD